MLKVVGDGWYDFSVILIKHLNSLQCKVFKGLYVTLQYSMYNGLLHLSYQVRLQSWQKEIRKTLRES